MIQDGILDTGKKRFRPIRNTFQFGSQTGYRSDQLLEVNSSRAQSDVDERVCESRKNMEAEIRGVLRQVSAIADRALARARAAGAGGTPAIEAALARLHALEREVVDLSRRVATV